MQEQPHFGDSHGFGTLRRTIVQKKVQWQQFHEDYAVGGGIGEGVKQAFSWGFWSGVAGGVGGGVIGGGIADVIAYSIDHAGANEGTPIFDAAIAGDDLLKNPYVTVPLILAGLSAIIAGGVGFYRGMISPAATGRRLREIEEYPWGTFFR
jgi:hypothetical protein